MPPAAADTLETYFKLSGALPSDFDAIVTGDLGDEGGSILCELLAASGVDISANYLDCGKKIATFDNGLDSTRDYVNDYFGGNGLAFAKKYFETVARLPERGGFDIIGHFDLASKNNDAGKFFDASAKEYLDMGFEAIHALRGKIPFFEVNTGAIARGYKTLPYPAMDFLKEFKALGFGAIITSDCHNKDYLDCNFSEARAILSAAGYDSRWIFTKDGFKEVVL